MEIYVHIPFCRQKCRYCDFVSFPRMQSHGEEYVSLLLKEAELRKSVFPQNVETIFIGGGTPSLLTPNALTALLRGLKNQFQPADDCEITCECNPGTLSQEWLKAAKAGGVNRISMGVQAAQDDLLKKLGRIHTADDAIRSVELIRHIGIENLNLDLMFGLPGQTLEQWVETLHFALHLNPQHLSCYGLIPQEGTPLFSDLESGRLTLPDVEEERMMYDIMLKTLSQAGYEQYEISNLAKPGYACRHNIGYWRQVPYLGLGLAASSMRRCKNTFSLRESNPSSYNAYRECILSGQFEPIEKLEISDQEAMFETMMLGLRMNEGVSNELFTSLHHQSLHDIFGKKLQEQARKGLVIYNGHHVRLTRTGMDLQNQILVELMPDK